MSATRSKTEHLVHVAQTCKTQADMADWYAVALRGPGDICWSAVNEAIVSRWSLSGLDRVKAMAWKKVEV